MYSCWKAINHSHMILRIRSGWVHMIYRVPYGCTTIWRGAYCGLRWSWGTLIITVNSYQIKYFYYSWLYSALELFIQMMVSIPRQYCDNYWNIYAYVIDATGWILWKAIPTHVHMDSCILRSIAWFHTASVLLRSTNSTILSCLLVILLITNEGYLLCIQWDYYLSKCYEMIIINH